MPSAAVERRTGNLPAEVTSFVGRRREMAEAKRLLEKSRLVTLLGPGGIGKTRLALQVAAEHRRAFADGAWMAELSTVRDTEMVPRAVADALQIAGHIAGDPVDLLADHLADRHVLLILDTCEHVADACALLADVLLRAAPRLRILATSREPLDIVGEHTLLVPPFDMPGPGPPGGGEGDSLTLFAERAAAVVPGFAVSAANRDSVAGLCRRLDGIPLAIELAAVRLRALSVDELLDRIDDRLRLVGTARGTRGRHRALRATIDWSHDLCTAGEKLLWARLSVFPGGFDLTAVERICAGDLLPVPDLLDTLSRLVEKSVVICDRGGRRYRMLDTLRGYGAERLAELGATQELRRRHRDRYLALALEYEAGCVGERQFAMLKTLRRERHNLRAALDFSLSTPGEECAALRMVTALRHHWMANGLFTEGRAWLGRALAAAPEPTLDRGWALEMAATLACLQHERAVAGPMFAEARAIAGRHGDEDLAAHVFDATSYLATTTGDLDRALAALRDAEAGYARVGRHDPVALGCAARLAAIHVYLGKPDEAIEICDEAVARCESVGEQWARSYALMVRGIARAVRGEAEPARRDAAAVLRAAASFGDPLGIAWSLDVIGASAGLRGDPERAVTLFAATEPMWAAMGYGVVTTAYRAIRRAWADSAGDALGETRRIAAARRGAAMSAAEVIAFALDEPAPAADPAGTAETSGTGVAPGSLTRREAEIAELVAGGLSNREIAERLIVSKRTVDSHVEHILAKLGFGSRTQIAAWVERRNRR